jgi:hypothetical protein
MNEGTVPRRYLSRVKIQVTAENIERACKADSRHCMIADAISTQLPGVRNISVDMMNIRWSDPSTGWRYIYMTPKAAQYALIDYDMGLPIEPFSFQVRSGLATPMILGTGKNRRRAHKVRENKILKVSDKGTIVHSVGRDSVPMDPNDHKRALSGGIGRNPVPPGHKGRPFEWHPSHNSLRRYGMLGFTEGYSKK